jgi:hypothetical protein
LRILSIARAGAGVLTRGNHVGLQDLPEPIGLAQPSFARPGKVRKLDEVAMEASARTL